MDAKEPNSNGVDRCVEMKVALPAVDGEFNDEACWKTRPALCECDVPGEVCNHDGKVDPGEECDDGNTHGGDGCSAACVVECPVGDNDGAFKDPVSHRCYVVPKTSKNWATRRASARPWAAPSTWPASTRSTSSGSCRRPRAGT